MVNSTQLMQLCTHLNTSSLFHTGFIVQKSFKPIYQLQLYNPEFMRSLLQSIFKLILRAVIISFVKFGCRKNHFCVHKARGLQILEIRKYRKHGSVQVIFCTQFVLKMYFIQGVPRNTTTFVILSMIILETIIIKQPKMWNA